MLVFARAFLAIKLAFFLFFIVAHFSHIIRPKARYFRIGIMQFYFAIIFVAIVASLVGMWYGRSFIAISDGFRLYVLWSLCYVVIFTLMIATRQLYSIHYAIVVAGICIALMNLFGLYDTYYGLGLIASDVYKELEMSIGFQDGYSRIMSHNIGSLFIVAPYLITFFFCDSERKYNRRLETTSLILTLLVVALSGRRGLWLVVGLTPIVIFVLNRFVRMQIKLRWQWTLFWRLYMIGGIAFVGFLLFTSLYESSVVVGYFQEAFSKYDARSVALRFLIDGFLEFPIFGSGFGGLVGYIRNVEAPWIFELVYFQMLYNVGLFGSSILLVTVFVFFFRLVRLLKTFNSAIPVSLLVAIVSLMIGSYSNPYLGSFDFLIFLGLIPYLTSLFSIADVRP